MAASRPATVTRPYRGASAEDRRAGRRARLLAAGLELLGEEGYGQTTVREVCRRAGLSPRYFYESFDDLDALVIAVFDGIVADAGARVLAAVDDAPGEAFAKARAAIGAFVTHLTDDPRRARVAFVEAMGVEALVRRRFDAMRGFADLVAAQGGAFYGVDPAGEPLVDVTASLLVGGMAELLMRWLDGDVPLAREQLIDDMTELFVATGESAVAIARRRARATKERR